MAGKIFHPKSEMLVLRTLTASQKSKASGSILASLDSNCFHTVYAREIYNRILAVAKKKNAITTWDDLASDPAISDTTRDKIITFKKKPLRLKEDVDKLIERLQTYRRLRLIWRAGLHISKELNKNSVDSIQLLNETSDILTKARSNSDTNKWFTNIGSGPKDLTGIRLLKKTLKVDESFYIPTGFRSYDARSIGIPIGTFGLIGTVSGGGKSIACGQLSEQMAAQGAKVCLVSLEMSDVELEQRQLARICNISLPELLRANKMSRNEKNKIKKTYKNFATKIRSNGGLLSYFIPDEDLTMEEVLLTLKPYGYNVIIIDYIGLLKGTDGDDQWKALSRATRTAKRYALTSQSIVLGAVQLDDDTAKVRYARAMKEHANWSWFWKWDETIKESGIIAIEMPKTRNQPQYTFFLKHDFAFSRFVSLTSKEEAMVSQSFKDKASNDNKSLKKKAKDDEVEVITRKPKSNFQDVNTKLKFFG